MGLCSGPRLAQPGGRELELTQSLHLQKPLRMRTELKPLALASALEGKRAAGGTHPAGIPQGQQGAGRQGLGPCERQLSGSPSRVPRMLCLLPARTDWAGEGRCLLEPQSPLDCPRGCEEGCRSRWGPQMSPSGGSSATSAGVGGPRTGLSPQSEGWEEGDTVRSGL